MFIKVKNIRNNIYNFSFVKENENNNLVQDDK